MIHKKLLILLLLIYLKGFSQTNDIELQNLSIITGVPLLKSNKYNILDEGEIKVTKNYDEYKYEKQNAKKYWVYKKDGKILRSYSNGINMILYNYDNEKLISSIYYTDMYFEMDSNLNFLKYTKKYLDSHHYINNKTKYNYNDKNQIISKTEYKSRGEETTYNYEYDTKGRISKVDGYIYEYDENDNLSFLIKRKINYTIGGIKGSLSEGTKYFYENNILSSSEDILKSSLKIQITSRDGSLKTGLVSPLVIDSYNLLTLQGAKVKIINNSNNEVESSNKLKYEYEFNEEGNWTKRTILKYNEKNNNYDIQSIKYHEFNQLILSDNN